MSLRTFNIVRGKEVIVCVTSYKQCMFCPFNLAFILGQKHLKFNESSVFSCCGARVATDIQGTISLHFHAGFDFEFCVV